MHKQVSPKFTVCFVDLASYLGISLKPLLDENKEGGREVTKQTSRDKESKMPMSLSQLERHQPSVIKEEVEPENDGEDSTSLDKLEQLQQSKERHSPRLANAPAIEEEKAMKRPTGHESLPAQKKTKKKHHSVAPSAPSQDLTSPSAKQSQGGLNLRKVSVHSNANRRSELDEDSYTPKDPVHKALRRNNGTPNYGREHDQSANNIFNNSMRSVGISEISQAFNLHFNPGNERIETNLSQSHRSTSI